MSDSEYYNDPIVKNGYFRGEETSNYVRRILSRWEDYKAKIRQ
jgi:membrane-bound lytic murein transglycosylase F